MTKINNIDEAISSITSAGWTVNKPANSWQWYWISRNTTSDAIKTKSFTTEDALIEFANELQLEAFL